MSASPAVDPMGTGRQKNAVEATRKGTKRQRAEENLHDTESGGSGTNWWYLEARRCRRCWLITDQPHWGNECGSEPGKTRRRRRRYEVIWCVYLLLIFLSSAVSFVKVSLARLETLTRLNE